MRFNDEVLVQRLELRGNSGDLGGEMIDDLGRIVTHSLEWGVSRDGHSMSRDRTVICDLGHVHMGRRGDRIYVHVPVEGPKCLHYPRPATVESSRDGLRSLWCSPRSSAFALKGQGDDIELLARLFHTGDWW